MAFSLFFFEGGKSPGVLLYPFISQAEMRTKGWFHFEKPPDNGFDFLHLDYFDC